MLRRLVLCLVFIGAAGVASAQPVYTPPGGSGLTPGSIVTGATNCMLYADAASALQCAAWLAALDAGADTPTITFTKTMSGSSATSNLFSAVNTLPATLTASAIAHRYAITGGGDSGSSAHVGLNLLLTPTWTGSGGAAAISGALTAAAPTTAIHVGVQGAAELAASSGMAVGVGGVAKNGNGRGYGGFFAISTDALPTEASPISAGLASVSGRAALAARNSTTTENIFMAFDNNTATFVIPDGGVVYSSPMALTAATMTAENTSQFRTATHSYTWTNAQVVALGAVTAGDITVATLPAKTQVIDAAVVITGAAVGPTTVTVACGRTSATYIDYIVASDAKAAANTVYGDAAAERGTNLTGYDLPSYTGTTAVVCHFVSTGANLSTVTGSTGRVILTTRLMP